MSLEKSLGWTALLVGHQSKRSNHSSTFNTLKDNHYSSTITH